MRTPQVWFTSSAFAIEPSEDEETNPGIYGHALAEWMAGQLAARGIETGPVLAEDWGWIFDARVGEARLGVGCANESGSTTRWSCVLMSSELPFVGLFRRQRTQRGLAALRAEVHAVLAASDVTDVEWES